MFMSLKLYSYRKGVLESFENFYIFNRMPSMRKLYSSTVTYFLKVTNLKYLLYLKRWELA